MLLHFKNVIHIRIFGTTYIYKKKKERKWKEPACLLDVPNRFGSCSLSIDQAFLSQSNSCSIFYLRRNILTKCFWNQKTPIGLFFLFRAFWMMTELYCGYWHFGLTLVIQKPESPVEDKLQRLFWLKENGSGCAGSNSSLSLSVFWDMGSDRRCPEKSSRTGWRFRDISSIDFPILQQDAIKGVALWI